MSLSFLTMELVCKKYIDLLHFYGWKYYSLLNSVHKRLSLVRNDFGAKLPSDLVIFSTFSLDFQK